MRLLEWSDQGDCSFYKNSADSSTRPYAILSHTWGAEDDEVTLQDMSAGRGRGKPGFEKIRFCGEQARRDGLRYFWVDTCCIDKTNSVELQEAITSMFRWYQKAERCYVHLADVSCPASEGERQTWEPDFRSSRWFRRGWTLQELLAPASVEFFSREGIRLGDKASLERQISEATAIPASALRGTPLSTFSIQDRLAWQESRQTKREEDKAYSLLGICGVQMPLIYGEGAENAYRRLRREIQENFPNLAEASIERQISHAPLTASFSGTNRYGMQIAQNHGTIQIQASRKDEKDNRPTNVYDIPDLLSPQFTGRLKELELIQRALQGHVGDSPARCVIYGMPGLGKTETALKYAETAYVMKLYPYIFWISATSVDKLVQGFCRLGDLVGLERGVSQGQNARCVAVRAWLEDNQSEQRRTWLLVLDNASEETTKDLQHMLPRSNGSGSILFTTRTKTIADLIANSFGNRHTSLELNTFEVVEAVDLLLHSAEIDKHQLSQDDFQTATGMVKSVGCLPLAIDQAGSLLKALGKDIKKLAEVYRGDEVKDALEWENGLSRYEQKSVIAVYASTLRQLEQSPAGTADLLRILTFLDPECISLEMIKYGWHSIYELQPQEHLQDVEKLLQSTVNLAKAIQQLERLSLVTCRTENSVKIFRIHDLVQLVLHIKLIDNADEGKRWFCLVVKIVALASSMIEDPQSPEFWAECEPYVSHIIRLQSFEQKEDFSARGLWIITSWIAAYLVSRGRYNEAGRIREQTLRRQKSILGEEHPDTLTSMSDLASIYHNQDRWREAEMLEVQVLEMRKRVLGNEHPATLESMSNLASVHQSQGRWSEAEKLQVQVIETRKRVLGNEHHNTLISMASLVPIYSGQERWNEAEALGLMVAEMMKRVLGEENPNTLQNISNLASIYSVQERWSEAEMLELQAIDTIKRVLGDQHPETLTRTSNLVSIYMDQKRWSEAEKLQIQIIKTRNRVSGEEHPETLTSISTLAMIYLSQGRLREAEITELQMIETKKRVLGEEHPNTLNSMSNLALIYWCQRRLREAETLEIHIIEATKRVFGEERLIALNSMFHLSTTYQGQGRWSEAVALQLQAIDILKRTLGDEHPDTLDSMEILAYIYREAGRNTDARVLLDDVVHKKSQQLGVNHPCTISARKALDQCSENDVKEQAQSRSDDLGS